MHTAQALASIRRSKVLDSALSVESAPDERSSLLQSKPSVSRSISSSSIASGAGNHRNGTMGSWKRDLLDTRDLLLGQYLNLLLLFAPLALWSALGGWGAAWVFGFNFLVMIPLANLLGEATEALAFHTGETIGGLVNATFGNIVEVVVAVLALADGQIVVVQSSLIGSVLSNLLLVLGCSFIAGGATKKENHFNAVGASANSSLLMLASLAMLIPSYIFYFSDHESESERVAKTLLVSRIAALFLLFMYAQLLFFQLYTHIDMFQEEADPDADAESVGLSMRASMMVLLVSTVLVAVFSEFLVSSIDGFAEELHISKPFIGIILLPIVGNAVEHVTAVKVALNDKMELAMGVAVGSATQVSLFVVPVVVLAGWAMNESMTLAFPRYEILVYLMAIVIVYAIIADGKSNWLEGSMLLTAYALVAVSLIWVNVPTN